MSNLGLQSLLIFLAFLIENYKIFFTFVFGAYKMEIYNYTVYHNFISDSVDVWLNDRHGKSINMKLLAEFVDVENALEEKELLSYQLFVEDGPELLFAGRLLFPWMEGWKYEGEYFDEIDLKEMGKRIYYGVGLWD
jgi:hypothetical protein